MAILFSMFILLVSLVILEVYSISWLWNKVGGAYTLLIVLGTGIVGAFIARKNAKLALSQLMSGTKAKQTPGKQIFDAISFFLAAALLIIPGIISDVAGLLLLLPITRSFIFNNFIVNSEAGKQFSTGFSQGEASKKNTLDSDDVIDIQAEEVK